MKLQGASTPRPMTHDLLSEVLDQMDAKCRQVSVTELRDNTFYASITVSMNGSELEIDSRPSDALALAVRTSAPIFAADDVIEESAIEFEDSAPRTRRRSSTRFKEFLDNVSPEDFAAGTDLRPQGGLGADQRPLGRALERQLEDPLDRLLGPARPPRLPSGRGWCPVSPGIAFTSASGPGRPGSDRRGRTPSGRASRRFAARRRAPRPTRPRPARPDRCSRCARSHAAPRS